MKNTRWSLYTSGLLILRKPALDQKRKKEDNKNNNQKQEIVTHLCCCRCEPRNHKDCQHWRQKERTRSIRILNSWRICKHGNSHQGSCWSRPGKVQVGAIPLGSRYLFLLPLFLPNALTHWLCRGNKGCGWYSGITSNRYKSGGTSLTRAIEWDYVKSQVLWVSHETKLAHVCSDMHLFYYRCKSPQGITAALYFFWTSLTVQSNYSWSVWFRARRLARNKGAGDPHTKGPWGIQPTSVSLWKRKNSTFVLVNLTVAIGTCTVKKYFSIPNWLWDNSRWF